MIYHRKEGEIVRNGINLTTCKNWRMMIVQIGRLRMRVEVSRYFWEMRASAMWLPKKSFY